MILMEKFGKNLKKVYICSIKNLKKVYNMAEQKSQKGANNYLVFDRFENFVSNF